MITKTIGPGSYIVLGRHPERLTAILENIFSGKISLNPDILVIVPETTIGIGEIRKVKKFLQRKNWRENGKAVAIREARRLTVPAQNALLKLLEEPGNNNFIFLEMENPQLLAPTIVSRCQILKGKPAEKKLKTNLVERLISLPAGKRRDAIAQLPRAEEKEIVARLIEEGQALLLSAPKKKLKPIAQSLARLTRAKKMMEANVNPEQVFDWLALNL